jgi:hypothetical protein
MNQNRRKFLGVGLVAGLSTIAATDSVKKTGKVKLIDAKGRILEIDADLYDKIKGSEKASNPDILSWIEADKSSNNEQ